MPSCWVVLKCIAKAVIVKGGKALLNGVSGGVLGKVVVDGLPEIAEYAWNEIEREVKDAQQRRQMLEALAQVSAREVRVQAAQLVLEVAPDQSVEVRQRLADYVSQVPTAVRNSLRRPSDPKGLTAPPGLVLRKGHDLLPFLPCRLPRFQAGDRPAGIGDWELVDLLGMGGYGEVWQARNHSITGLPPAALKFCLDPAAADVLRHEGALLARVMSQGRHAGIVQLKHTFFNADPPCLEYEYIEGADLGGLIQEWQRRGSVKPAVAARIVQRLAEVVGFAHRLTPPIVHRDLKPANILVQQTADGKLKFKVTDFGIGGLAVSQAIAEQRSDATRGLVAATAARGSYTPLYASPQQMAGKPPDPRDDVYALGIVWYQLLSGDLTVGAPTGLGWLDELREKGMTDAEIQLLACCFEGRPEKRPADAAELAERLGRLRAPVVDAAAQERAESPELEKSQQLANDARSAGVGDSSASAVSGGSLPADQLLKALRRFRDCLYMSPAIPVKKEKNVRANCRIPEADSVVALIYPTHLFGSTTNALAFGCRGLYYHNLSGPGRGVGFVSYDDLRGRSFRPSGPYDVDLGDGHAFRHLGSGIKQERMIEMLTVVQHLVDIVRAGGGQKESVCLPADAVLKVLGRFRAWSSLYLTPAIPAKKEQNARASCEVPADETMVALVDATVFGSAKDALVFGCRGLYYHNGVGGTVKGSGAVPYEDLLGQAITLTGREVTFGDGHAFFLPGSAKLISTLKAVQDLAATVKESKTKQ